jgi:hypothetical protein
VNSRRSLAQQREDFLGLRRFVDSITRPGNSLTLQPLEGL